MCLGPVIELAVIDVQGLYSGDAELCPVSYHKGRTSAEEVSKLVDNFTQEWWSVES